MRICVFGAGAIGGLLAARLTAAGEDVSVVVRGAQKDAIARNGLKVFGLPEGELNVWPRVAGAIVDAGPQDLIVLAVKARLNVWYLGLGFLVSVRIWLKRFQGL